MNITEWEELEMMDFEKLVEKLQFECTYEIEIGIFDRVLEECTNLDEAFEMLDDMNADGEMPYYRQVKQFINEFFEEINGTLVEFEYNIQVRRGDDLTEIANKVFNFWVMMARERLEEAVYEMEN